MPSVTFRPYIGKKYSSGGIFGKRILVLGESHYCAEDEVCESLTADVLHRYLEHEVGERWMSTFKKFERSLGGKVTDADDSAKIWESLAFYNFLQVPMGYARMAGSKEDYRNAAGPFFEVLSELEPDCMIVWGKRLWNNLPGEKWSDSQPVIVDGYENPVGTYALQNSHEVLATPVYHHPSAGFSWDYCWRVFKELGIVS